MAVIFNMAGGGGGGGLGLDKLNVIGSVTEPANPTKNTIWIKTDIEITDYSLSSFQPNSTDPGLVWIRLADTGGELPVGKNGRVLLHILSARLWNGSTWDYKDGYIYNNSQWVQFSFIGLDLYDAGNEFKDLTGGWGVTNHGGGRSAIESDHIKISFSTTDSNKISNIHTRRKIDISGYSTLCITWTITRNDRNVYFGLGSGTALAGGEYTAKAVITKEIGEFTTRVDISNVASNYVVIYATAVMGTVSRVWLER